MSFLQHLRLVKVSMERSPYFWLACPNDACRAVPAGASIRLRVRFTAKESKVRLEEAKRRIISKAIVLPALWVQPIPCCELGSRPWAGSLQPVPPWHALAGTAPRPDRLCFPSLHIPEHSQGKMQREQYGNDRGVLIVHRCLAISRYSGRGLLIMESTRGTKRPESFPPS